MSDTISVKSIGILQGIVICYNIYNLVFIVIENFHYN